MPKFMIEATYNAEGTKGLLKEGGTSRRTAVKKAVEDLGGTLEAFYFAFGDTDAIVICDVPDVISGIAIAMAVDASGEVQVKTTPLITPEEIDAACHKAVHYRAPGR
ncbi:MAG: GYD domain-containing protein [Vicinamibacteria bacterium]|nr:GYD domain-containing protein [Vicinamibacteria bacterium]